MEQINLPIKTKVAAWWMIIFAVYFLYIFLKDLRTFISLEWDVLPEFLVLRSIALPFILFIFLGIFLLRKSTWAWWVTMIGLPIYLLGRIWLAAVLLRNFEGSSFLELRHFLTAGSEAILIIVAILFPLVLLYIDRKNFIKTV